MWGGSLAWLTRLMYTLMWITFGHFIHKGKRVFHKSKRVIHINVYNKTGQGVAKVWSYL